MKCSLEAKYSESVEAVEISPGKPALVRGKICILTDRSDGITVTFCDLKTGELVEVNHEDHVLILEQTQEADFEISQK